MADPVIMADPVNGSERPTDSAGFAPPGGSRSIVERVLRSENNKGDILDGSPLELAAALVKLATAKQEMGHYVEAEELLSRALTISESNLGPDHPDLVILLNELTRLHLQQSEYRAAEPFLLRLLDIKRSKGENHPEVATVLASLAAVHRALGQHESAEQLSRRVLEIRERTLAPNHFSVATALEHLAEACEARGKLGEALQLFQRAHTIRELTLGIEHPSVPASRERIADLQLRTTENSLGPVSPAVLVETPYGHPLWERGRAEPSPSRPFDRESRGLAPFRRSPPLFDREPSPGWARRDEAALPSAEGTIGRVDEPLANSALYRDVLHGTTDDLDETSEGEMVGAGAWLAVKAMLEFLWKRRAAAGTAAVLMALIAVALRAGGPRDDNVEPSSAAIEHVSPLGDSLPPAQASKLDLPTRAATVDTDHQLKTAVLTAKPVDKAATSPSGGPQRRPRARDVSEKTTEAKNVSIPVVSNSVTLRLDALASRAANVPGRPIGVEFPVPAPPVFSSQRSSFEYGDQSSEPSQRARLIGELPTPRIPDQLADVEGDVRVRFNVDTAGRPVMSTLLVESSPNPLLTAAVRRVIPGIRFEPARTADPDSKPIGDVVQIGFHFARNR